MTTTNQLDIKRVRELFDLRESYNAHVGGGYEGDPYVKWNALREEAPVHAGTPHELLGIEDDLFFHGLPYPDRPHFTAFSFEACDAAYRNPAVFASSTEGEDDALSSMNSMLTMEGQQHRRYRALVQPSFVPAKAKWWVQNWIQSCAESLVNSLAGTGRAELNTDFCAAIPLLTITGSFGIPVEQALDVRSAHRDTGRIIEIIAPILAARRIEPRDDLLSILVEAEITDENGDTHRLSDAEIFSFTLLLLFAGSGTTWKQMGMTLTTLLERPELLEAVREDRSLLRPVVEEVLRWQPTDPAFGRWVTEDIDFFGVHLPKGSVLHLCLGAANRDPARWDNPDVFDHARPQRASLAFGSGPHICLGMHVARAEIHVGVSAILDHLPNVRLDPEAEAPRFIGVYERGATTIPVLFD